MGAEEECSYQKRKRHTKPLCLRMGIVERLYENTAKRHASTSQGEGPHQKSTLMPLWTWTSNLQDSEKRNFFGLSDPVWCFIMAALASGYKGDWCLLLKQGEEWQTMSDVADRSVKWKLTLTGNVESTGDLDNVVSLHWSELKREWEKWKQRPNMDKVYKRWWTGVVTGGRLWEHERGLVIWEILKQVLCW